MCFEQGKVGLGHSEAAITRRARGGELEPKAENRAAPGGGFGKQFTGGSYLRRVCVF